MDSSDIRRLIDESEIIEKISHFFPLKMRSACTHPEHNAPTQIVIPQGMGYEHVCPNCGKVQVIIPTQITL